jgi:hypothetical protein
LNEGARVERLESELWCATKMGWRTGQSVVTKILFYLYFSRVFGAIFRAPKRPHKHRCSTPDKPVRWDSSEWPPHTFFEALLHQWRQAH